MYVVVNDDAKSSDPDKMLFDNMS